MHLQHGVGYQKELCFGLTVWSLYITTAFTVAVVHWRRGGKVSNVTLPTVTFTVAKTDFTLIPPVNHICEGLPSSKVRFERAHVHSPWRGIPSYISYNYTSVLIAIKLPQLSNVSSGLSLFGLAFAAKCPPEGFCSRRRS